MYEFPPQAELAPLVGQRVAHVTFHPFTIELQLEGEILIQVTRLLEYVTSDGQRELLNPEEHFGATALHRIVNKVVTVVHRAPLQLTLGIEDGQRVIVHSNLGSYEAGFIRINHDQYVF
jgi:hypothetical protein